MTLNCKVKCKILSLTKKTDTLTINSDHSESSTVIGDQEVCFDFKITFNTMLVTLLRLYAMHMAF